MEFTQKQNIKLVCALLFLAVITQVAYTGLYVAAKDVPRLWLWSVEGLVFIVLIAVAGAALVQEKKYILSAGKNNGKLSNFSSKDKNGEFIDRSKYYFNAKGNKIREINKNGIVINYYHENDSEDLLKYKNIVASESGINDQTVHILVDENGQKSRILNFNN